MFRHRRPQQDQSNPGWIAHVEMDEAERIESLSRGRQPHADDLQDILDLRVGIGTGFDLAVYHQHHVIFAGK